MADHGLSGLDFGHDGGADATCCNCHRQFFVRFVACGALSATCSHCGTIQQPKFLNVPKQATVYKYPHSGMPRVHYVGEFGLMGCMATLAGYQSGDLVRYGGMLFAPESGDNRYLYSRWTNSGGHQSEFRAELWNDGKVFFAS